MAFGYFETLIALGDDNKFAEEEARIRSLSNVMSAAGFDTMLYKDFEDEFLDLMRKVASALQDGTAETVLLEAFNDDMLQNYIITHFRVWLSSNLHEPEMPMLIFRRHLQLHG